MKNKIRKIAMLCASALMLTTTACGADLAKDIANANDVTQAEPTFAPENLIVTGPAVEIENYDITKIVKLGNYKKIRIEYETTDKEVEDMKKSLLEQRPKREELDSGVAEKGQTVNLDFVGTVNGEDIEGGRAKGIDIELGTGKLIGDFEDKIVGMSVGETKNIDVTLPDDYDNPELAGKTVVFNTKLNKIIKMTENEFDDAFVKANTTYETVSDFNKYIKRDRTEKKIEENLMDDALLKIVDESEIKEIPKTLLEAEKNNLLSDIQAQMKTNNTTVQEYATQVGYNSEAELYKAVDKQAEIMAKTELIIEAIIKKEGGTTKEELESYTAKIAEENGQTIDEFKNNYAEYYQKTFTFNRYMKNTMEYDLVMDILQESVKGINKNNKTN